MEANGRKESAAEVADNSVDGLELKPEGSDTLPVDAENSDAKEKKENETDHDTSDNINGEEQAPSGGKFPSDEGTNEKMDNKTDPVTSATITMPQVTLTNVVVGGSGDNAVANLAADNVIPSLNPVHLNINSFSNYEKQTKTQPSCFALFSIFSTVFI